VSTEGTNWKILHNVNFKFSFFSLLPPKFYFQELNEIDGI
jgi:hypothetical protein